uniref:Protein kinase domain-containing protein n=1 Tax=Plectus sambesii TaxID=2011161 RepID=A0A914WNL6_9BILA
MPLTYIPLSVAKQDEDNETVDEQFEIPSADLTILPVAKLGTGHFGDVHRALLRESDGKQIMVAVKKLKVSTDVDLSPQQRAEEYLQHLKSLQCETKIMSSIGTHPNVLRLIGAVTKNRDDFCIITEYCEYGSLEKFLTDKEKQEKFINEYVVSSNDGYRLPTSEFYWKRQRDSSWDANFEQRRKEGLVTTSDLVWFGFQIAHAVEFLMNKSILHRDLALRNMLLTDGYIVKVADFGLSRQIHNGIYQPSQPSAMPIAYLAPEVLQYRQFSKKSESWAFGIVLWELFTLAGRQPYQNECGHVDESSVGAFLGSDKRLPMPEFASFSMRKLIAELWNKDPADRPDFVVVKTKIVDELQNANPHLEALAQQAMNLDCSTSSRPSDSLISYEMLDKEQLKPQKVVRVNEPSRKRIPEHRKARCFILIAALVVAAILLVVLLFLWIQSQELAPRNETQLNSTTTNTEKNTGTARGPENLRAWRSMLLVTGDGREIMKGNDFHRNGFVYSKKGSWDLETWASNSTFIKNKTDNDPLTLKIEVFVDRASIGCKAPEAKPPTLINYEEECNRLPTNAKLFYNGTCYVGSNTETHFDHAIKLCNDIPWAAVSRLAWIESEHLLEMLRKHLIVHERSGLKVFCFALAYIHEAAALSL